MEKTWQKLWNAFETCQSKNKIFDKAKPRARQKTGKRILTGEETANYRLVGIPIRNGTATAIMALRLALRGFRASTSHFVSSSAFFRSLERNLRMLFRARITKRINWNLKLTNRLRNLFGLEKGNGFVGFSTKTN